MIDRPRNRSGTDPCERAVAIERAEDAKRITEDTAGPRNSAVSGLEPCDSGVVGRLPDAAAAVGPDAQCGAARGHQGRGAAAAAARCARQIERIVGAAVEVVVRFAAAAHLGNVRETEHDGAFGAQSRHCGRVTFGGGAQHRTATGAFESGDVHDVLDHHRQSMRPANRSTAGDTGVGFVCGGQALLRIGGLHERVQRGIDFVDAREVCLDDLPAGDRPAGHQRHQVVGRQLTEIGHARSSRYSDAVQVAVSTRNVVVGAVIRLQRRHLLIAIAEATSVLYGVAHIAMTHVT